MRILIRRSTSLVMLVFALLSQSCMEEKVSPTAADRTRGPSSRKAEKPTTASLEKQVASFFKRPYRMADVYEQLTKCFKGVSSADIRQLKQSKNVTVALLAAWREVQIREGLFITNYSNSLERGSVLRFLGFLEGRTQINVPPWWERTLLSSGIVNRSVGIPLFDLSTCTTSPRPRDKQRETYEFNEELRLSVPSKLQISKMESGINISTFYLGNRRTIIIPTSSFKKIKRKTSGGMIYVKFDRKHVYLAIFNNSGSFWVWCLEKDSGRLVWDAIVWGGGYGMGGNWDNQELDIFECGNCVVIFGASNIGMFVEAFDIENGKVLFRFSTSFWTLSRSVRNRT